MSSKTTRAVAQVTRLDKTNDLQQKGTATLLPSIDLIRPAQASDLHYRPGSSSLQLVHTKEIRRVGPLVRRDSAVRSLRHGRSVIRAEQLLGDRREGA